MSEKNSLWLSLCFVDPTEGTLDKMFVAPLFSEAKGEGGEGVLQQVLVLGEQTYLMVF